MNTPPLRYVSLDMNTPPLQNFFITFNTIGKTQEDAFYSFWTELGFMNREGYDEAKAKHPKTFKLYDDTFWNNYW